MSSIAYIAVLSCIIFPLPHPYLCILTVYLLCIAFESYYLNLCLTYFACFQLNYFHCLDLGYCISR